MKKQFSKNLDAWELKLDKAGRSSKLQESDNCDRKPRLLLWGTRNVKLVRRLWLTTINIMPKIKKIITYTTCKSVFRNNISHL